MHMSLSFATKFASMLCAWSKQNKGKYPQCSISIKEHRVGGKLTAHNLRNSRQHYFFSTEILILVNTNVKHNYVVNLTSHIL